MATTTTKALDALIECIVEVQYADQLAMRTGTDEPGGQEHQQRQNDIAAASGAVMALIGGGTASAFTNYALALGAWRAAEFVRAQS